MDDRENSYPVQRHVPVTVNMEVPPPPRIYLHNEGIGSLYIVTYCMCCGIPECGTYSCKSQHNYDKSRRVRACQNDITTKSITSNTFECHCDVIQVTLSR